MRYTYAEQLARLREIAALRAKRRAGNSHTPAPVERERWLLTDSGPRRFVGCETLDDALAGCAARGLTMERELSQKEYDDARTQN